MAGKATLAGSVKAKVWAGVMSGIAAVAGSSTMYFWNTITGQNTAKEQPAASQRPSFGKSKFYYRPAPGQPAMFRPGKPREEESKYCALLGCRLLEEQGRVQIVDVPPGSPAAHMGFAAGDIIESINSRPMQTVLEIGVAAGRAGKLLSSEMTVLRKDARLEGDFRVRSDDTLSVRTALHPSGERTAARTSQPDAVKKDSKGFTGRRN